MSSAERIFALIVGVLGIGYVIRSENHGPTLFGENGKRAAFSFITLLISMSALTLVFGYLFLAFTAGLLIGFVLGATLAGFERK